MRPSADQVMPSTRVSRTGRSGTAVRVMVYWPSLTLIVTPMLGMSPMRSLRVSRMSSTVMPESLTMVMVSVSPALAGATSRSMDLSRWSASVHCAMKVSYWGELMVTASPTCSVEALSSRARIWSSRVGAMPSRGLGSGMWMNIMSLSAGEGSEDCVAGGGCNRPREGVPGACGDSGGGDEGVLGDAEGEALLRCDFGDGA